MHTDCQTLYCALVETEHLCSVHVLCILKRFYCDTVSRDLTSVFCSCSVYIEKVLLWYSIKRMNICVLFKFCVHWRSFVVIQYQETEHLCFVHVHWESFVLIQYQENEHLCSVQVLCTLKKFCCDTVSRDWTSVFCSYSVYIEKVLFWCSIFCVLFMFCVNWESFVLIQYQETEHLCFVHALFTLRKFCFDTVSSVFCSCSV